MEGILFARNKDGNKTLIGPNQDKSKARWLDVKDEKVIEVVKTLKFNAVVEYKYDEKEEGKNGILTSISLLKSPEGVKPETNSPTIEPVKSSYGKSPAEQDSIKRQAIMHGVARTLISMQGQVDVNNVCSLIDMLYKKYQEKVA